MPVVTKSDFPFNYESKSSGNKYRLLFIGRLHPKKGIDNLLEAWYLTKPIKHNWQLVIAGETKNISYMKIRDSFVIM